MTDEQTDAICSRLADIAAALRALFKRLEAAKSSGASAPSSHDAPSGSSEPLHSREFHVSIDKHVFEWKNGGGSTYAAVADSPIDFGGGKKAKFVKLFVSRRACSFTLAEGDRVAVSLDKLEVGEYRGKPTFSAFCSSVVLINRDPALDEQFDSPSDDGIDSGSPADEDPPF